MVNWTGWSSPIEQASCDIWVYESEGQEVKRFEQRWGGYEIETLIRVLSEGHGQEKAFALLALGLLAPPEVNALLFPFLHSSVRYLYLRSTIALLLGAWNNSRAVPSLRNALQTAWVVEQRPAPFFARKEICSDGWHIYQDRLAYALGQLGAFGSLFNLNTSNNRLTIALAYLIFGSLKILPESNFVPELAPYLFSSLSGLTPVVRILEVQFGWLKEEQDTFLRQFKQDCHTRLS